MNPLATVLIVTFGFVGILAFLLHVIDRAFSKRAWQDTYDITDDSDVVDTEFVDTSGWYEVCTVGENGRTTHFESRDAKNAYERAVEFYKTFGRPDASCSDLPVYIVRDERFIMTFCEHGELIEVAATPEEHTELLDCVHQHHKLGKYHVHVSTDDTALGDLPLVNSGDSREVVIPKIYTVNHWKNVKPVIMTTSLADCIKIVESLMAQKIDGITTIWIASAENGADKLVAHFECEDDKWRLLANSLRHVADQERELLEKVC